MRGPHPTWQHDGVGGTYILVRSLGLFPMTEILYLCIMMNVTVVSSSILGTAPTLQSHYGPKQSPVSLPPGQLNVPPVGPKILEEDSPSCGL